MDAAFYRAKAEECRREAEQADSVEDKVAWVELAATWLRLQQQATREPADSTS